MNERIRELAEQAREKKFDYRAREGESHYIYVLNVEKFAELIVLKCAEIADKSNTGSKSSNERTEFYYNADIGDKIKEHFGINGMSTEDKKTLIKELLGVKE